jgi:hypothetical protein
LVAPLIFFITKLTIFQLQYKRLFKKIIQYIHRVYGTTKAKCTVRQSKKVTSIGSQRRTQFDFFEPALVFEPLATGWFRFLGRGLLIRGGSSGGAGGLRAF